MVANYSFQDLQLVPALSGETVKFLKSPQLGPVAIPYLATALKKIADELEDVQKHPIKNTVFAITRSIATAGVIAGGVLAAIFSSYPILTCTILAGVYLFLAADNASINQFSLNFNIWDLGLLVLGGPVFPLAGRVNKEERLESRIQAYKLMIEVHLEQRKKVFTEDLSGKIKALKIAVDVPNPDIEKNRIAAQILKEINENVAFFAKM